MVVPDNPKEIRTLSEDFADDYDSDEYIYDREPSIFARIRAWIIDWLRSLFSMSSNNAADTWELIKLIFYILVIGGVLLYIIKVLVDKDIRWLFNKNKNVQSELDFDEEQQMAQADFEQLIKEAVQNKDYRSAVRYYYLLLLRKLDQKAILSYDAQKTTIDYQLELEGSKFGTLFSKAAYYYTYIWYGEFIISEEEYQTTATHYNSLLNSIKNE